MTRGRSVATTAILLGIALAPASARAEPTKAECIDADTDAQSLRRAGRFAESRERLRACMDPACPSIVSRDCASRLDELDGVQPNIVFEVEDPEGRDLPGVVITADGRSVPPALEGTAIERDPGPHVFTFEAPGRVSVTQTFVLREGEKGRRERVVLMPRAELSAELAPRAEPAPTTAPPVAPTVAPPVAASGGWQRPAAWTVGGIGLAAIASGVVAAILAVDANDASRSHCGPVIGAPPGQCDPEGLHDHDEAVTRGAIADVMLITGGLAVAAGVALLVTAPRGQAGVAVLVGPGAGAVRASF
jgi:hypothetical protein